MTASITFLDPKRPELGSDESIVKRVLDGERSLYEVLMRRHNQRVYRTARAILRSDGDIEDVMQEAYVQAFTHLAQFRSEALFSTWLTRIAVHAALARLRRDQRQTPTEESDLEHAATSHSPHENMATPEQSAGTREIALLLERAIDALPDTFREVLVLRTIEEMSVAETASALDIPEDTVKTRLFRARGLLREALEDRMLDASEQAFLFHAPRCNRVVAAVMSRIG
jgi:RNA polymerase sigma-70 factor (ECF subfamily)